MTLPVVDPPPPGASLLMEPAYVAVRRVALARVDDMEAAFARFNAGDTEGLHDVRVAMRRLRTWIAAFRSSINDTVGRKTRRRLRDLARATNDARDAEVAAEWVAAQDGVSPRAAPGVRAALEVLLSERDAALKSAKHELDDKLPQLIARLRAQLALADAPPPAPAGPVFAVAAWSVLEKQAERLTRALAGASTPSETDAVHRARIAAKRLRYILEPLHAPDGVKERLASLVELQDLLGTARDAHGVARRYVREVGEMAARDARREALAAIGVRRTAQARTARRVKHGYIELARRAHLNERRSFAAFRRRWGPRKSVELLAELTEPFRIISA